MLPRLMLPAVLIIHKLQVHCYD